MRTETVTDYFQGRAISSASARPAPVARCVVAMIGTYPPTECGLATFTSSLASAITDGSAGWQVIVARVLGAPEVEIHQEVVAHWVSSDPDSLVNVVLAIESADVVVLQHEYGLFGGRDGEDVLALLENLRVPLIVVLHSVLSNPSAHQRHIIDQLGGCAARIVVQSEHARRRLVEHYRIQIEHIDVVAHGAAENFLDDSATLSTTPNILTWGLLGPGKGIEHAIEAVAQLENHDPVPVYRVVGATHPKVLAHEGEKYRHFLQELSRSLGVEAHIEFDDGYRDWHSLRALVREADVVLLPYDSMDQESSGVLVEALASGKPVIATMFPHAVELLSHGSGLLVEQGDVGAMRAALERVLYEPGLAQEMGRCARRDAAELMWPVIGERYRTLIGEVLALERTS